MKINCDRLPFVAAVAGGAVGAAFGALVSIPPFTSAVTETTRRICLEQFANMNITTVGHSCAKLASFVNSRSVAIQVGTTAIIALCAIVGAGATTTLIYYRPCCREPAREYSNI